MNDHNVIKFERRDTEQPPKPGHPPLINLPPVTKYFLILIIAIHAVVSFALSPDMQSALFLTFGFVPYLWTGLWTGNNLFGFDILSAASPLTYMVLHGSWLHLFMNGAMLMAFGAGVERVMGPRKYILFFILCGLLSLFPEIIIHPQLQSPLVGASGALSGLFAAILIILQRTGRLPTGRYGIWPFAVIWVLISVLFGLFGSQMAGASIAWLAHLGGFFGGFILLRLPYFRLSRG